MHEYILIGFKQYAARSLLTAGEDVIDVVTDTGGVISAPGGKTGGVGIEHCDKESVFREDLDCESKRLRSGVSSDMDVLLSSSMAKGRVVRHDKE